MSSWKAPKLEWDLESMADEMGQAWFACLGRVKKYSPSMIQQAIDNTDVLKEAVHWCDSPIEVRLLAGLLSHNWGDISKPICCKVVKNTQEFAASNHPITLAVQQEIGRYRADFMLCVHRKVNRVFIAVEADGALYHLDKEKDEKRDAELLKFGIHTVRLSGTEITRNLWGAMKLVDDMANVWESGDG